MLATSDYLIWQTLSESNYRMKTNIQLKLDKLLRLYEEKHYSLAKSLKPGLSEEEIKKKCTWFPVGLSKELLEIYTWRNGQIGDPSEEKYPFWFRDNAFCSIERAKEAYDNIVKVYAEDNIPERDGVDLLKCFPFAEFNGECYLLPCSSQSMDNKHMRPVINQNGEIYYYSIDAMLDTVIDWVKCPEYKMFESLPEEIELKIWRKHNPGIF